MCHICVSFTLCDYTLVYYMMLHKSLTQYDCVLHISLAAEVDKTEEKTEGNVEEQASDEAKDEDKDREETEAAGDKEESAKENDDREEEKAELHSHRAHRPHTLQQYFCHKNLSSLVEYTP